MLDRDERWQALNKLRDAAIADNALCWKFSQLDTEREAFWRRMTYRTVFASIETLARFLRQTALLFTESGGGPFSVAERMALSERSYEVSGDGSVIEKSAKIRTLDGICLSLDAIARSAGVTYVIKKSKGWSALCAANKVRDRLTHPKTVEDFAVTEEEMDLLLCGWRWYMDELGRAVCRPEWKTE